MNWIGLPSPNYHILYLYNVTGERGSFNAFDWTRYLDSSMRVNMNLSNLHNI